MNTSILKIFYLLKPLMPRRLQIALRQVRANRILETQAAPYLADGAFSIEPGDSIWPQGRKSCILLTHDVETERGLRNIDRIRNVEKRFGYKSTWNFVLDKYGPVDEYVKKLQGDGCECGAHGLFHDGKLFSNHQIFSERMERINSKAVSLGLKGFRSPSLLRDMDMLRELEFDWVSSIPSWDPFQPQPGGCNRYLPFHISEKTLELPVTMWQDFTIFSELRQKSSDIWKKQANQLHASGALLNIIVHPDYFTGITEKSYTSFLKMVSELDNAMVALPSEVVSLYRKSNN